VADKPYTTSIRIEAPPEQVFPYLTDPDLLVRWMGEHAELEPSEGGRYAVDILGVAVRGRFVEVVPPSRLVVTWGVAGNDTFPAGSTTVEIVLHRDGAATLLELTHHDLPPDELPRHDQGWAHFLARLTVAAAGGDPGPDPWADSSTD
jgi:uncharacterized protein YndB with AHSA1/START domain